MKNFEEFLTEEITVEDVISARFNKDAQSNTVKSLILYSSEQCEDELDIWDELFDGENEACTFLSLMMSLIAYGDRHNYFDKKVSIKEFYEFLSSIED